MNLINEDALAVMIAKVVKEQRPSLEEDVIANEVVKEIDLCKQNF